LHSERVNKVRLKGFNSHKPTLIFKYGKGEDLSLNQRIDLVF
jgi:hypothetical protein